MNMKLSAKPISSPGRTEKFPPPLMRFLRSNVGSRSRGRSRSSPMFVRKKTTAIETQEPSSPKVTCMGQVRVRRSSKQNATKRDRTPATRRRRRCRWLRHALFCHAKIRPCQPLWPKWGFFRRKATKVRQDSTRTESNSRERHNEDDELEEDEHEDRANDNTNVSVSVSTTTPPKNALLLTRCRSAPYRSSSLACRFLGSPLRTEETGEEQRTKMENTEFKENGKESAWDYGGRIDPTTQEKFGFFKELEDSIKERMTKSENVGELERVEGGGDCARPLILTRCKSEPARTTQKLDPELNFWKKRRLGLNNSCSPHDCD